MSLSGAANILLLSDNISLICRGTPSRRFLPFAYPRRRALETCTPLGPFFQFNEVFDKKMLPNNGSAVPFGIGAHLHPWNPGSGTVFSIYKYHCKHHLTKILIGGGGGRVD